MFNGQLISIHITPLESQPMEMCDQIQAVPGKGLEGDRYYSETGADPDRQVTLIESEAIRAIEREAGITLPAGEARRNLVTQGVPLNHLVGKEFQVGEVRLRGVRLCEPCNHLAKMTEPGVLPALVHRGGLRAQVLSGGMIRVGDVITAD